MCGVIGLIFENERQDLGLIAAKLLKMLEYRGYDSTGAVVQDSLGNITLLKDVGAPSEISRKLGIDSLFGQIFCGQVRWATFGVVSKENAQPHEVACKTHLYGAHNGNITNCQRLKDWLISEGHNVKSDNDGEMLVHVFEHFFALELASADPQDLAFREKALINAARESSKNLEGSFASIICDPISKKIVAIKAGSSLYLGHGSDPVGGEFFIASSDLASVLQLTHILIPIKEQELAVFAHNRLDLYDLKSGAKIERPSQRSLLKFEETKLHPSFKYFMEQEIFGQVKTSRRLITLYTGGNTLTKILRKHKKQSPMLEKIKTIVQRLAKIPDRNKLQDEWVDFLASKEAKLFNSMVKKWVNGNQSTGFESSHASFLEELKALASSEHKNSLLFFLKGIDAIFDLEDVESIERRVSECIKILHSAKRRGNNVYFVACGSSFHAAKTAPLFFNEIARLSVIPLLPGEFRTQCSNSLCDGDVIIGISQSGETKDLIDIFNMVSQSKKSVKCICILNNTNSTLALEKSDVFIPLLCGPEIAVPATKSFMSQLLVLFILAIRLDELSRKASKKSSQNASASKDYLSMIEQIPDLIDLTLKSTSNEIEKVSSDLCLHPSIHILATRINGVAKEGALKIREIVLNHTEGFEGSEFKHGPNTILGLNTIFGFDSLSAVLHSFCDSISPILMDRKSISLQMGQIFNSFINAAFKAPYSKLQNIDDENLFQKIFQGHRLFENLYKNYPLLFITSPEKQDIHLTISQINTHKIRGADVYLVAEDDEQLQKAVSIPPAGAGSYQFGYIIIPKTGNPLLAPFSITVVLQLLALKMSQKKMEFLKTLKIFNHGVHPDSPKNVSKSITVD